RHAWLVHGLERQPHIVSREVGAVGGAVVAAQLAAVACGVERRRAKGQRGQQGAVGAVHRHKRLLEERRDGVYGSGGRLVVAVRLGLGAQGGNDSCRWLKPHTAARAPPDDGARHHYDKSKYCNEFCRLSQNLAAWLNCCPW